MTTSFSIELSLIPPDNASIPKSPIPKFLNSQISFLHLLIGFELFIASFINDLAIVKDAVLVRNSRCKPGVLLDQENGDTCFPDFLEYGADLPDQHRGQSFCRFIEKHELEVHGENSCDGQHLLFPAGELRALLVRSLPENREILVDLLKIPKTSFTPLRRQREILENREAGKDHPFLRDIAHAQGRDGMWFLAANIHPVEGNGSLLWRDDSHNSSEGRCLAHSVTAQEGSQLSLFYLRGDPFEDVAFTIIGMDVLEEEAPQIPPRYAS